jgi:transcriptional regulator with XRE-family HTH domain
MVTNRLLTIKQPKIGKLIRELRLASGLTQEQFAASLGVVYPTVNRWENGHAQPSPLAIQNIEKMLQKLGEPGLELLRRHQGDTPQPL